MVLAVVLLQAVGFSLAAPVPCVELCEQCDDDGPDGQCAPTCVDCLCCAHTRAAFSGPTWPVRDLGVRARILLVPDGEPPQGELEEILRVPKHRFSPSSADLSPLIAG